MVWNMFKVNNKSTKTTSLKSLLFLLLTFNIFHIFFCLYCWLWTSKCSLGWKKLIYYFQNNKLSHTRKCVFNNYILQITPILYFLKLTDRIRTPRNCSTKNNRASGQEVLCKKRCSTLTILCKPLLGMNEELILILPLIIFFLQNLESIILTFLFGIILLIKLPKVEHIF